MTLHMLINLLAFPLQLVPEGTEGLECCIVLSDTDVICRNEKV